MKRHFYFLLPLLLADCATKPGAHVVARELREQGVEPPSIQVAHDDAAMRRAVVQARRSVGRFITAVQHPAAGQGSFEVKKPFVQGDVVEHIWLSEVKWSGGRFHGKVDNRPRNITGVKFGDLVSVNPNEITDWAFVEKGKLVGGYTIRTLCAKLPPEERKACEAQLGCRIGSE